MRLQKRSVRIWNESYLVYVPLWKNLELACSYAREACHCSEPMLLDIGCGNKPYTDLFPNWRHIGLNPTTIDATPDVVGDATRLPFKDEIADAVLCTQVLEHVSRPWELMSECRRVLKPGGFLILSAPFYWPLHEEPWDFFRYTRHGLKSLVISENMEVLTLLADGGDGSRLMISVLHYLPRFLSLPARIPLNLIGLLLDKVRYKETLPQNYTLLARKPSVE